MAPGRGQWRFLCRVSFPVWLASLVKALARLFLQFPFSPFFFTSELSSIGRGRWVRGFCTEKNCPCVWPRRPHLPTPQHTCSQWGLCNTGPKRTPAFPPKQETRICRALVFLLISCFAAPSPDYFLYSFLVPLRLVILNQRFVCRHQETNCFDEA